MSLKISLFVLVLLITSFSFSQEICDNGIDDTGNGLIDLNDPSCKCNGIDGGTSGSSSMIPNPSFEDMTSCPDKGGQPERATGWSGNFSGSSDYFNCGFGNNLAGKTASDGSGFMAAAFMNNWREYIGVCLNETMIAGETYYLTLDISAMSRGDHNYPCVFDEPMPDVDVSIFGNPVCGNTATPKNNCPATLGSNWSLIGSVTYTPNIEWSDITIEITPSVNIEKIMIGAPCDLPNDNHYKLMGSNCYAYFFFDNLRFSAPNVKSIDIESSGSICTDNLILKAAIDTVGGDWQWYKDNIAIVGEANSTLDISGNNYTPGSYTVRYMLNENCENAVYVVEPPDLPTAKFEFSNICIGNSTVLTDASTSENSSIKDWSWDLDGDGIFDEFVQNTTHTFNTPGDHNVTLRVVDSEGCAHDTTITITIEPLVSSSFTLTDFCEGTENSASGITVPGGTFSFKPAVTDGATINETTGEITNGVKGKTYNVQYTPPGKCVIDSVKSITVKANPEFNISYIDPTCGNIDGQITIEYLLPGDSYIVDYSFNGKLTGPKIFSANTIGEIVISNLSEGEYTNFDITGANGCNSIDESTVVLTEPAPPIVTAPNDIDLCIGEGVILTADNPDGATISWDHGVSDGVKFYPTVLGPTIYIVTATIDNCTTTDKVEVHVHPLPVPSFVGDELQGCDPHTVNFTNTTDGSSNICLWNFGDGNSASNCNTTENTYATSGFYDVSLTVTDEFGCTGTTIKKNYIDVIAMPIADFTADPMIINSEDTEVNFTNESSNASHYNWDFGDGSPTESGFNVTHKYTVDGLGSFIVTLIAANDFGCVDTAYLEILVKEELIYYIPNSFTPNNDGLNEMFQPIFTSGFDPQDFKLLIFNRWGELVFESRNTEIGWDGSYGNNIVKDGVYVWSIEFKEKLTDKKHSNQGFVNLVR